MMDANLANNLQTDPYPRIRAGKAAQLRDRAGLELLIWNETNQRIYYWN